MLRWRLVSSSALNERCESRLGVQADQALRRAVTAPILEPTDQAFPNPVSLLNIPMRTGPPARDRCPRPLPEAMGWPDLTLREQYDANRRAADGPGLSQDTSANESEIRVRQTRQRAVLSQPVGNDLAGRFRASEAETKAKIDRGARKSRRTPELSARTTRRRCASARSVPTMAETERSGIRWAPTRASQTSALRPRLSRSASGTSTKTAFRSQVPSHNRRHHSETRNRRRRRPPEK